MASNCKTYRIEGLPIKATIVVLQYKRTRPKPQLNTQFEKSNELHERIQANLKRI